MSKYMSWQGSNQKQPFAEMVAQAAAHFRQKYGRIKYVCAHPSCVAAADGEMVGDVLVRPSRTVSYPSMLQVFGEEGA